MDSLRKAISSRERAAALIIVLAFVVLLTGLVIAHLSRVTADRPVAHSSVHQSKADQVAASAMDLVIGALRQEITGPSPTPTPPYLNANVLLMRSGNPPIVGGVDPVPNLIRRSVRSDTLSSPAVPSLASFVNSTTDVSANGRFISLPRWNKHYLVPKLNTGDDKTDPVASFVAPDWVILTRNGPVAFSTWNAALANQIPTNNSYAVGRYAYAIYDEGGLLDANVAGYPSGTTTTQAGRKGSLAFADLKALGTYPIPNPNGSGVYQIDRLVGWRNYATIQPAFNFPDVSPVSKAFANNFQGDSTPATNFYKFVVNNTNGFLSTSGATWQLSSNTLRTDQAFLSRQELIAFQKTLNTNNGNPIANTSQFDPNALQYLGTFSRETNSPSFSPSTPTGSTIDYAALASSATAVNPNFLLRRVTTSFTRFDGTTANVGDPLLKTRFPLSRLAWITYRGPSALRTFPPQSPALPATDPNFDMWSLLWTYGVSQTFLQAGTAANIQTYFGLTFPVGGTAGSPWTYTNPTGVVAASRIMRLDEVAAAGREPDFFELLQAAISNGSLGQSTGGGVTGGAVFPDIHMNSTTHHILSIGAAIIDQADPDSIPTRIQFIGTNLNTWTAYGVENLPYITQLYPIAGVSPDDPTKWATYLLFQLWNPHQNAPSPLPAPVRLRVDGGIGIFSGDSGGTWNSGNPPSIVANGATAGQSVTLNSIASFSTPAPLTNGNTTATAPAAVQTFGALYAPALPTPTP